MNRQRTTNNRQLKRGFAMLFAVFIAGLMTSIGLAIFNIALKEVALSGTGRESQFAFYAADTGAECALYWDYKNNIFINPPSSGIFCNGVDVALGPWVVTIKDIPANPPDPAEKSTTTQFAINLPVGGSAYCVEVKVKKAEQGSTKITTVESRGYNGGYRDNGAAPDDCFGDMPSKVERGLRVTY